MRARAAARRKAKEYLRKHQLMPGRIRRAPARGLGLVVVIPCHDEPEVLATLEDLHRCADSGCVVEVIVVINASEAGNEGTRARNADSLRAIESRAAEFEADGRFRVHAVNYPRLPARHAGVGLARKLGMDEALARIIDAGGEDGIIVSLDADCRVEENYLCAMADHFARHAASPACSVYFEHPLAGPLSDAHYRAVTDYELYLRYYRHGLLLAGHPCAHYTVGSCMAVRASAYARQGGMNRRKGAEDFHFLNKLMLLGGFSELRGTTVRPSPRLSGRVPFGTGRALREALAKPPQSLRVWAPEAFDDLAALFARIDRLRDDPASVFPALSGVMNDYLAASGIHHKLAEIARHTATAASFRSRFFRWFDGLCALKFVRYASAQGYGQRPVAQAALALLQRRRLAKGTEGARARELLRRYRRLDRDGETGAASPALTKAQRA